MDALAVSVIGDRVDIGKMRSRKFGRPLSIGYTTKPIRSFHLGWFDFESIVRGIAMRGVSDFAIDGRRQAGRSPNTPNEKRGRNNLLLSGISNGHFGPMDLSDAPEHAIRFGGGRDPDPLVSQHVTFAPLTIRRASASAIKINPTVSARVRHVTFERIDVIDPFWQMGKNAKASHLIRISHADDIVIRAGSVQRTETPPPESTHGVIFAIADSSGIDIGPFTVTCCAHRLVAFIEDNDWNGSAAFGDIRNVRLRRSRSD